MKRFLRIAAKNLKNRRLRTWLTLVGIVIGIAAVVSLVSVGQGLEQAITEQFETLGRDVLIIQPEGAGFGPQGESTATPLRERDLETIGKTRGVIETSGLVTRSARIMFKDEVNFQIVNGLPLGTGEERDLAQRITTQDVAQGRNLQTGDKFNALVGNDYTEEELVFPQKVRVGDKIDIKNTTFDVVGVLESIGNAADDRQVVIPRDTAEQLFGLDRSDPQLDFLAAQVEGDIKEVRDRVKRELRTFRNVDEGEEDFQIRTPQDIQESFNTVIGLVQAVLVGIAAISLLVAAVGIMNTMYTSVVQRTTDIGVMKAVGARNSDVLSVFLAESSLLGMAGGALGTVLGYGISRSIVFAVTTYFSEQYMTLVFPVWLAAGAIIFSTVVGGISGIYPALQASKKDPVDSLRYE